MTIAPKAGKRWERLQPTLEIDSVRRNPLLREMVLLITWEIDMFSTQNLSKCFDGVIEERAVMQFLAHDAKTFLVHVYVGKKAAGDLIEIQARSVEDIEAVFLRQGFSSSFAGEVRTKWTLPQAWSAGDMAPSQVVEHR